MTAIETCIVDDERLSRRRLRRLLGNDPDLRIADEWENAQEALLSLNGRAPDLLFLDIQMPGIDGFGFLDALAGDRMPCTIFVTAFDDYAVRAFEVHAFDYLLKPFDDQRLFDSVRRAKEFILHRRPDAERVQPAPEIPAPARMFRDRLAVRVKENVILLRVSQVDWIEAADNYVCLHCGQETHVLRETMNSLERTLDPDVFLRIHRSTIVNVDRIKALQPWFRGDYRVLLSTGAELTLSRSHRQNLQNRVLKF